MEAERAREKERERARGEGEKGRGLLGFLVRKPGRGEGDETGEEKKKVDEKE